MTRCGTVDEALDLIGELPRDFAGAGMLADRSGALALVEIGRRRVRVSDRLRPASGGTAVNVNCWVSMQEEEGAPLSSLDNPSVPNQSRYLRAKELLGRTEGSIDLRTMAALLSDHAHKDRFAGENPWIPGHGYSICNHGSLHGERFESETPAWGIGQCRNHRPRQRHLLVCLWLALRFEPGARRPDAAGTLMGPLRGLSARRHAGRQLHERDRRADPSRPQPMGPSRTHAQGQRIRRTGRNASIAPWRQAPSRPSTVPGTEGMVSGSRKS